jgi:mannose-6-phosphate isomerase-like protein (cupin superfamily)
MNDPLRHQRNALDLNRLDLDEVNAHGGEGKILFNRVLGADDFRGPWNFVDYAVLPPGASIGLHTHGANEELYLVLAGEGLMHVDGREFRVREGSLVLNRPGGTHGLSNDGEDSLKLLVVEVRV